MSIAVLLMLCNSPLLLLHSQTSKPIFWRGVYLFGLPEPRPADAFFYTLRDSLHLNLFQVRTFGVVRGRERTDCFLNNAAGMKVITLSVPIAEAADSPESEMAAGPPSKVTNEAALLLKYRNHFRFYLADEPTPGKYGSFAAVAGSLRKTVAQSTDRTEGVTAVLSEFDRFIAIGKPSELLVETYIITNNIPHPSLVGRDAISSNAGIMAWGDTAVGWYFGNLQQQVNLGLSQGLRPAAIAVQKTKKRVSLIVVPQLHGILSAKTRMYDRDTLIHENLSLRPPSPAEIRLQYNLGLAYGAKGFLAYPYGFEAGHESRSETYPGLVSDHPSQTFHFSDVDTVHGKEIWTGFAEKWREFAAMNRRFKTLGDSLLTLSWVGAKGWTMEQHTWEPTVATSGTWSGIVLACSAKTLSGYRDDLPQVEIGHLRRGKTDYLVVVNRRCSNRDIARITLSLGKPNSKSARTWKVTDVERRTSLTVQNDLTVTDRFDPGEGKIYRIEMVR